MKPNLNKWNWLLLASVAIFAACATGCSKNKSVGSAIGTVTWGGKPVTSGSVLFSDSATGTGATAPLDASGKYQIGSIPVGTYQVAITLPPAPAPHEMQQATMQNVNIPAMYQTPQTSNLTAAVKEGENSFDFKL